MKEAGLLISSYTLISRCLLLPALQPPPPFCATPSYLGYGLMAARAKVIEAGKEDPNHPCFAKGSSLKYSYAGVCLAVCVCVSVDGWICVFGNGGCGEGWAAGRRERLGDDGKQEGGALGGLCPSAHTRYTPTLKTHPPTPNPTQPQQVRSTQLVR